MHLLNKNILNHYNTFKGHFVCDLFSEIIRFFWINQHIDYSTLFRNGPSKRCCLRPEETQSQFLLYIGKI